MSTLLENEFVSVALEAARRNENRLHAQEIAAQKAGCASITELLEKRNVLRIKATNIVYDCLAFANVSYGAAGITEHVDNYVIDKFPLVQLLRKSPYWNEDALAVIVPNVKEVMKPDDTNSMSRFRDLTRAVEEKLSLCRHIYHDDFVCQFVTESLAEYINSFAEHTATVGMKTTKAVCRLMKKLGADLSSEDLRKPYQAYADAISPYEMTKTFVLSANPADYLLSSNGPNWSSCHIINPDLVNGRDLKATHSSTFSGCYKAGTLSYMCDPCTLVGYTVENKPFKPSELWREMKDTRQLFHVNLKEKAVMQARLYPYTHDEDRRTLYRHLIQDIFAVCFDAENSWIKSKRVSSFFDTADDSMHYRDYEYSENCCNVSILRKQQPAAIGESEEGSDISFVCERVKIGSVPICLKCGEERDDGESNLLYCYRCREHVCRSCGCTIGRYSDVIRIYDEEYCSDCAAICECCERASTMDDITYIEGYGSVCYRCIRSGRVDVAPCDRCDNYVLEDNLYRTTDGRYCYCANCADHELTVCERCEDVIRSNDVYVIDGHAYCSGCAEALEAEEIA